MILKSLRWAARTRRGIFVIALLLFITGALGSVKLTSAYYQAGFDTPTATFAGGYVAAPTISTVVASGYDSRLTWTNGVDETTTDNEIQQIFGADQGTTNNCTTADYSTTVLGSTTSRTTTATFHYTDSNRAITPSAINGDWYCYEIVHGWPDTTTPAWTTPATTIAQVGLAPQSVVIANGGTSGTIDKGDTVVITYNQNVTGPACAGAGCTDVCEFRTTGTQNDTILLGDTTCSNASTDTYTVGKITGVTLGGPNNTATAVGAKVTLPGTTVTLTLTSNAGGKTVTTYSGTTFVSSTTVLSNATGDQATACTAANSNCQLTSSTSPANLSGSF